MTGATIRFTSTANDLFATGNGNVVSMDLPAPPERNRFTTRAYTAWEGQMATAAAALCQLLGIKAKPGSKRKRNAKTKGASA